MEFQGDTRPEEEVSSFDTPAAVSLPGRGDIERAVRTLIAATGEDPDREGLSETPARVARAWREWFAGYAIDPAALLARTFSEANGYEERSRSDRYRWSRPASITSRGSRVSRTSPIARRIASSASRSFRASSMPLPGACNSRND